jgi:hypothetical protein
MSGWIAGEQAEVRVNSSAASRVPRSVCTYFQQRK